MTSSRVTPLFNRAPAADATAPAPNHEGSKPLMAAVQSIRPPGEVITLARWYDHKGNVADLAVHIMENGRPDLVGEVVEHPKRFTAEYHAMRAAEAELDAPWPDSAA